MLQHIPAYFPDLTPVQLAQFEQFIPAFTEWNNRINMVSRKDIDQLEQHHILHSLGIATVMNFAPGSMILDVGTGGGFPGLPLAIMFPDAQFTLIDRVGKKIMVVNEMIKLLGLNNVTAIHGTAEELKSQFDFVTGRGVTDLNVFTGWVKHKIAPRQINALPNGILYLKGGDLKPELRPFGQRAQVFSLRREFDLPFFETKAVVYIELAK